MKTKEEIAAQRAEHYATNRERLKEKTRLYREQNREKTRAYARNYIAEHADEKHEYDVHYRARTRELRKKSARDYNQAHAAERAAYQREYRRLHPHEKSPNQVRAHADVHNALRRGDLIRPDICSKCSKVCKPQAHHPDYSKTLEVVWLCKSCHTAEHF